MDAAYYLKNLVGRQKEEEQKVRVVFRSPRRIDAAFARAILESVSALLAPGFDRSALAADVAEQLPLFRTFAPIEREDSSDQYYFDLQLYCAYEQAKRLLPSSQDRLRFRSRLGDRVLDLVLAQPGGQHVPLPLPPPLQAQAQGQAQAQAQAQAQVQVLSQEQVAAGVAAILSVFQSTGQISGFLFDEADFADAEFAARSFEARMPVAATIQLREPATVLSFIQGVRLNTFFHPEFIGACLVAYLARVGLGARFEDYLLDNYYRESNFDVQAQDVVLELQVREDPAFALGA